MTATASSGTTHAARPVLSSPMSRPERRRGLLIVALPALLAAGLCLYELGTRSLWLDEAATVAIAGQHGAAFGAALARDGGNMLGYYGLLHVVITWFGSAAWVIRLPSVIAAAVTAGAVARLGDRLFGGRIGLTAGVLTAVSLSLVYWGQDARGYAPMLALVALSFLAFLALIEGGGGWSWLAYVAVTTAAVYAGLEAVLVIPAQLVALAWHRNRLRPTLAALAVIAACCIPLAVLAASRGSGQLFWVPAPSLRVLNQVAQALTSAGLQPGFYTSTTTALLVLSLSVMAGGLVGLWQVHRAGDTASCRGATLVLAWTLVPVALAALESAFGTSIFQARYLLVSLPAVSLFLAWAIAVRGVPTLVTLAVLAALLTLRALQLAPAYGVSPENWRGATGFVMGHERPGDCLAFYPSDNRQAFKYYLRRDETPPEPILPAVPWGRIRSFVEDYSSLTPRQVTALPNQCRRVWLVSSHEGRAGGAPLSRGNYLRYVALTDGLARRYRRAQTLSFSPQRVVTVTLYSR
jgi:mannosyltransferase